MAEKKKWIQKTGINEPAKKGSLRREVHVAPGKKIPEKKLEKATHSKSLPEKRRAVLAETLKGFHKK
jgi:hypothetical protein